ncbi:MAG: hypothetical protein Q8R30_04700 [bacterium]|nr:hypothetical protein [bacterium]
MSHKRDDIASKNYHKPEGGLRAEVCRGFLAMKYWCFMPLLRDRGDHCFVVMRPSVSLKADGDAFSSDRSNSPGVLWWVLLPRVVLPIENHSHQDRLKLFCYGGVSGRHLFLIIDARLKIQVHQGNNRNTLPLAELSEAREEIRTDMQ